VHSQQHTDPAPHQPVNSDVDLRLARSASSRREEARSLAVISLGGAVGAVARYLIGVAWPTPRGSFPWATFVINVSGCALIGVLMVLVTDVWRRQRLLRPFLGTGVLGGYTTFSTYAVDVQQLVDAGKARTGLLYLAGTLVAALAAVSAGIVVTRLATRRGRTR
jgi:fluoride exporter